MRQRHRGVPVFAGDVTVIAGPRGAPGVRGTLIDGRDEYAHSMIRSPAAAVRTGDEACDGADPGDATGEDHGLVSGALACNAACSLDLSQCEQPLPDGSSSTTTIDPTTGRPPTPSPSTGPDPSDPGGLFISPDSPEPGDAGCGCREGGVPPSLPAALALLLLRRRPRR